MAYKTEHLDDPRFNQIMVLSPDPAVGRFTPFKIKYADYGYRNDEVHEVHPEEEDVFIFFGSMVVSRLIHVAKDELAIRHRIRIMNPDRPGLGGKDAADAEHVVPFFPLLPRLRLPALPLTSVLSMPNLREFLLQHRVVVCPPYSRIAI